MDFILNMCWKLLFPGHICIKEREQEEDDIVVISLACRECGTTGEDNLLSVKNFPVGKEEELGAAYESDMWTTQQNKRFSMLNTRNY